MFWSDDMKKRYKLLLIFIILASFFVPINTVKADTGSLWSFFEKSAKAIIEEAKKPENNKNNSVTENVDCNYVFGDPKNESSTAYMIQKALDYIKILAPLLVILLSGFDFAKNALSGDQDEMKKATKKLGIRIACAAGIYLAPLLAGFLIDFINESSVESTCNIK